MTLDYIYNRIQTELDKGRKLIFDIWLDTSKAADKKEMTLEEIKELFENNPDTGFLRIRMYWVYGANSTKRFLEELTAKIAKSNSMSGVEEDEEIKEEKEQKNINPFPQLPMALDSNNPLSWMLQERTSQLDTVTRKYDKIKEKAEKLREEKEKLEREIIRKDHAIENLTTQAEEGQGLNGFLSQNPGVAEKAIEVLGPTLTTLISQNQKAIADEENHYSDTAKDIAEWITNQTDDYQDHFYVIVQQIALRSKNDPNFLEALKNYFEKLSKKQENGTTLKVG